MAVLVNCSRGPIVMDTLPVIKLTEWYGTPGRDEVYAYARFYLREDALCLSMTVFDGCPPATQRAIAAFEFGGQLFELRFLPSQKMEWQCFENGAWKAQPASACVFSAGSDEQGWYWQAQCTLPAAALNKAGLQLPQPNESFCGGFFLTDELEEAFGSAFRFCGTGIPTPDHHCFTKFSVISY